jgi:glycine/D-amino acid oxidase-like deaminating enzyme
MRPNCPPWRDELEITRSSTALDTDTTIDVAIIGGGIAGLATAFFILRETTEQVVLLEAGSVAGGASGYNAGQLVTYFEKPLGALVDEYGFDLAIAAQREIDDAWSLLDEIQAEAGLAMPIRRFVGHMGMWSENHLAVHLRSDRLRQVGGLKLERCIVSDRADVSVLESDYGDLFEVVSQSHISELLQTNDARYRAVLSFEKGTANSVMLCEQIVSYLLERHGDRFRLFEGTPVERIELYRDKAILTANSAVVRAGRVVLCTNGYQDHEIVNRTGPPIATSKQQRVQRTIGFMAAYFMPQKAEPAAISYLASQGIGQGQAYFYLTKRDFHFEGEEGTLVCIGGPDVDLTPDQGYERDRPIGSRVMQHLDEFIRPILFRDCDAPPTYRWAWHGVMGYTRNGIRVIGSDPRNGVLLYNFGCNGVGLLPSVYGGRRIARLIAGEQLPPSIFDPS